MAVFGATAWRQSLLALAVLVIFAESAARAVLDDTTGAVVTAAGDIAHILTSPLRMSTDDALEVGAFLAATGLIWIFDQEILDAVNRNAEEFPLQPMLEVGRWLDPIGYGSMNVYYLGGLGISYATGPETGTAMFAQIVESFAVYGLLKIPVQELVGRARPYQGEGNDAFGYDDSTSFPSGHTINAFQLATVVSHHVNRSWFTWRLTSAPPASVCSGSSPSRTGRATSSCRPSAASRSPAASSACTSSGA